MLTINPLLLGFASYNCLIRYRGQKLFNGVLLNSLIFIVIAIASDLIFFVAIRNAFDKLMSLTTLYAWGFVMFFPLIIYALFKKGNYKKKEGTCNFQLQATIIYWHNFFCYNYFNTNIRY